MADKEFSTSTGVFGHELLNITKDTTVQEVFDFYSKRSPTASTQTLPAPQKEGFFSHLSKVAAGKQALFPIEEGDNLPTKLFKTVGSVVGAIPARAANLGTGLIQAPFAISQARRQADIAKSFEALDAQVAKRIDELKANPTEENKEKLRRLMQFMADRNVPNMDIVPINLDKSVSQTVGETLDAELMALTFVGGIGFQNIPFFKQSLAKLGIGAGGLGKGMAKAGSSMWWKGLAATTAGITAETAAFAGAGLLSDKDIKEITKEDIRDTALFTAIFGVLAGGVLGGVSAAKFRGWKPGTPMPKELKQVAANAARFTKAAEVLDRVPASPKTGPFNRVRKFFFRQGRAVIDDVTTAAPDTTKAGGLTTARFTGKVRPGDIVESTTGVAGRIGKVLTLDAKKSEQTLLQSAERLFAKASILKEGVDVTPAQLLEATGLEKTADELLALAAKKKSSTFKAVELQVPSGEGLSSIEVPLAELRGGTAISRELYVPENLAKLRAEDPTLARNLVVLGEELQNGVLAQPSRVRVLEERGLVRTFDVDPQTAIQTNRYAPTADVVADLLTSRGMSREAADDFVRQHALFSEGFNPKRSTVLHGLLPFTSELRRSGIDPAFLLEAERLAGRQVASSSERFLTMADDALEEAGFSAISIREGDNVLEQLRKTIFAKSMPEEFSEQLVRASSGDQAAFQALGPKGKNLVNFVRSEAKRLAEAVNIARKASGDKPIPFQEDYFPRVLEETARAFQRRKLPTPESVADAISGRGFTLDRYRPGVFSQNLLKRSGGLPAKTDFMKGVLGLIESEHRFAVLHPETTKMAALIESFNKMTGHKFPVNTKVMTQFMDIMSGKKARFSELDDISRAIQDALIRADAMFGTNFFSVQVPKEFLEARPEFRTLKNRLPKESVAKFTESGVMPHNWPRLAKNAFYKITLGLNPAYMVTNLTQPFLNTVPQLSARSDRNVVMRQLEAMGDVFKGMARASAEFYSPAMRRAWRERGVLEQSDRIMDIIMSDKKQGGFLKIFTFIPQWSEYINRVGTAYATHANIARAAERGNLGKFWKELDGLTGAELKKMSETLSERMSDMTQFRVSQGRAPLSEHWLGGLYDQFNTFLRSQIEYGQRIARDFRNSYGEGSWQGFIGLAKQHMDNGTFWTEFVPSFKDTTERRIAMQYGLNVLALGGLVSTMGGNFWSEFVVAGVQQQRWIDGMKDLGTSVATGDFDAAQRAFTQLGMPPSIPPMWDAARDGYYLATNPEQYTKSPGSVTYKFVKAVKTKNYSPFKRAAFSIDAAKALLLQRPVPVYNDKGAITGVIRPEEAVQSMLFASRAKTIEERYELLSEISKIRAKDRQEQTVRRVRAVEIYDMLSTTPPGEADKIFANLVATGELLDPKMLQAVVDAANDRILLRDAVDRNLATLTVEGRAEFIEKYLFPLLPTDEDRLQWLKNETAKGTISNQVLVEMAK